MAGYGHLLPMVPLIRAAQRGGHEVVVSSGGDMAALVERLGVAAHRSGRDPGRVLRPAAGPGDGQRAARRGAAAASPHGTSSVPGRWTGPVTCWTCCDVAAGPRGARHAGAGFGRPPRPCTASRTSPTATARRSRARTLLRGGHRGPRSPRPGLPDPIADVLRRAVPRHLPTEPARGRAEPVAGDAPAASRRRARPTRRRCDRAGPVGAAAPGHGLRHPRHDHEPGARRCSGP